MSTGLTFRASPHRLFFAGTAAACLLLATWLVLSWFVLRAPSVALDWAAWRESDTQTIAINGLRPDAEFNVPLVNWGGAQPRPVEAEFQLYTGLITAILRLSGPAEWPGQAVSLCAMAAAALALFLWLRSGYGPAAAFAGLSTLLASRIALFLGTSVQPDGLSFALLVFAWISFARWLDQRRSGDWLLWVTALSLSSLVKVTNLQLGIAMFLLVVFAHRGALRQPALWGGWALILLANAIQLRHGAQIYAETGLSFGIASGGDNKFPRPADLLQLQHWIDLAWASLRWGIGPLGAIAGLWLALRRRLTPPLWAFTIAHLIGLLVAMRYTSDESLGPHYHAPGALLAALLIAEWVRVETAEKRTAMRRCSLAISLISLITASLLWNAKFRLCELRDAGGGRQALVRFSAAIRDRIPRDSALLVRSEVRHRVDGWQNSVNNFEDPRILYLLGESGWILARDDDEVQQIVDARDRGAKWLIEPQDWGSQGAQLDWLKNNAQLILDGPDGRLWKL